MPNAIKFIRNCQNEASLIQLPRTVDNGFIQFDENVVIIYMSAIRKTGCKADNYMVIAFFRTHP